MEAVRNFSNYSWLLSTFFAHATQEDTYTAPMEVSDQWKLLWLSKENY